MNHKRLMSITISFIFPLVAGLSVLSFAGNESGTNTEAEQHFEKANELRKLANHDGAITEYKKVISLSPNSRIAQDAQYWIGQSHFKAGHFDAALAAFQGLANEYPRSAIIPSTQLMIGRVEQSKEEKALVEAVKNGDIEQLKLLISKGADVNAKVKAEVATYDGDTTYVEEGWTLLNLAARYSQTDIAALLISKGADVNGRVEFDNRKCPLHWVGHFGPAALAELLITKNADVNALERYGYTALYCAAMRGNLEVAEVLISNGADVNAGDEWGNRPLHAAVRRGHLEVVELLISKGADIEAAHIRGIRPLHFAARRGHLEVVKLLISKGADINARDGNGTQPLYDAALVGNLEIAKLLIKKGAYVDSGNNLNLTPLHAAIVGGNQDMVELLLANGVAPWRQCEGLNPVGAAMALGSANPHQKEMVRFLIDKGIEHSAVQVAAFFGDTNEVKRYLAAGGDINAQESSWLTLLACAVLGGHKDEAEFLISKGADINRRGAEGKSALHWAVFSNRPEILRMLLDRGADTEIRDVRGHTALFLAAYWHHPFLGAKRDDEDMVNMVKILLAKGADVNASGRGGLFDEDEGWTPLHWPCRNGFGEMVEVLIAHGADVNAKSKNGETPMSLAKYREHIVEMLRRHGAKE